MAGLYDGLEEAAFKPVTGGYIFQTSNPWFVGPQRRYFVSEVQKAEIAACLRRTMRRLTPFVLVAAVIIPLVLVGAISWLVLSGGSCISLTVDSLLDQVSHSTVTTLPLGPTGATFPYAASPPAGSVAITALGVSGPPGAAAVANFTVVDQTGKSTTYSQPFGSGGAKFTFNVDNGSIVFTLRAVPARSTGTVGVYAMLLALGMFLPYIAVVHVYRMRKLQPLIVDLPPSDERITLHENTALMAGKMSSKYLVLAIVMVVCNIAGFSRSAINLTQAIMAGRPIAQMDLLTMAAAGFAAGYFGYLLILRLKLRRSGSDPMAPRPA